MGKTMKVMGIGILAWAMVSCGSVMRVQLYEWAIAPSSVIAQEGDVQIVVTNTGTVEHNMVLFRGGAPLNGVIVEPDSTMEFNVHLYNGTYVLKCTIVGHDHAGMVGSIEVR